jgi:hypothetical protein
MIFFSGLIMDILDRGRHHRSFIRKVNAFLRLLHCAGIAQERGKIVFDIFVDCRSPWADPSNDLSLLYFYGWRPEAATILAAVSLPSEGPPKPVDRIISFESDAL